jgi:hypothetical protein
MRACNLAIFTICSNNYVPMATVLVETARQYHPEAEIYLCLADKPLPNADFYPPNCHVIAAEELDVPDFTRFAFRYDVMEFNTALKPFMFLHLLRQGHDAILYLDPDIELFAPLDGICHALEHGASFVLTPHLLHPAEGNIRPDDVDIMLAGIYNLGFLGVGATSETVAILEWWARRLRTQCVSEQSRGLFVDQKFIDLVPGFADHVKILRDSHFNVAYWNLAQRKLTYNGSGWDVDGAPLGFFHFSGFDPADLTVTSKHTAALRDSAIPFPVGAILRHYSDRVLANGFQAKRSVPYAYGHFASGAPIDASVRWAFRNHYEDFSGDPFAEFEAVVPTLDPRLPLRSSPEELARQLLVVYPFIWKLTWPLRAIRRLWQGRRVTF